MENPIIILEPEGKNTAPAISLAAIYAREYFKKDGLIVVETEDVALVVNKNKSQVVKEIVGQLKDNNSDECVFQIGMEVHQLIKYKYGEICHS